jgi:hypothetical protein
MVIKGIKVMSKPDKQHNPYKYICYTIAAVIIVITVYLAWLGLDVAFDDIATWRNGGVPPHMIASDDYVSRNGIEVTP